MQYLLYVGACITWLATGRSSSAYAIKCYSCESIYETNCGENFKIENHFKYECAFTAPPRFLENDLSSPNATGCLKRVFKENGIQKFVRGCYFGDVNETDIGCRLDPTLIAVQDASCHVCANGDYCNAAEATSEQQTGWKLLTLFVFILAARILNIG